MSLSTISIPPSSDGKDFLSLLAELAKLDNPHARAAVARQIRDLAESGYSVEAMCWCADAYLNGADGFPADADAAVALLEEALLRGSKDALLTLASIYEGIKLKEVGLRNPAEEIEGEASTVRYPHLTQRKRALELYRLGAELDLPYALAWMARKYSSLEKAEKAYDLGSPHATLLLGRWNLNGMPSCGTTNVDYGFRFLEQGYSRAIPLKDSTTDTVWQELNFELGRCYEFGWGVDTQLSRAHHYYTQAADAGHVEAAEWLEAHPDAKSGEESGDPASPMSYFKNEIKPLPTGEELDKLLEPLTSLTGLDNVKKEIRSLVEVAQVQLLRKAGGLQPVPLTLHSVFSGPPGTGKTTVARLLGEILHGLGYLSKGHVVETDRSQLISPYIGESSTKTRDVIESAMGGILFIDEAYTLTEIKYHSTTDHGFEAIAMLLKMMEDSRNRFIVIAAGYQAEMTRFLASNPGLRSRFSNIINFPAFDHEQLVTIFENMCAQHGMLLPDETQRAMSGGVRSLLRQGKLAPANARGVRDLFEKTIRRQAHRIVRDGIVAAPEVLILMPEDFAGAGEDNIVRL